VAAGSTLGSGAMAMGEGSAISTSAVDSAARNIAG